MSSARQGLSIVGQIAGSFFGPIGAALGGIIGGEIGGYIDGPPEGPRLEDLSAPSIEYGSQVPWVEGRVWCDLSPLWWSGLRESSETVGGKGGDSGVEQFSYHCDMLGRLANGANVIAWTRIEIDGEIVATRLADSSTESLQTSAETERWADVQLFTGAPSQSPWSVYEAAVGAANASAYFGQCTIGFQNLFMRNGRSPSRIRVEVITKGTPGDTTALTRLQFNADDTDISAYAQGEAVPTGTIGYATFGPGGYALDTGPANNSSLDCRAYWTNKTELGGGYTAGGPITIEAIVDITHNGNISLIPLFSWLSISGDASTRHDVCIVNGATIGYNNAGFGLELDTGIAASGTLHLALQFGPSGSYVFVNGAAGISTGAATPSLGASGDIIIGPISAFTFDGQRLQFEVRELAFRGREMYDPAGFDPPATLEPPDTTYETWSPEPEDLRDVLERMALRCRPLTLSEIDFAAAAGKDVHGYKHVGSAAQAMQPLLTRFYLDLYCDDKLRLVARGGAVEQAIPFAWSGAGGQGGFAGLVRDNDTEVRKRTAITYINRLSDGEKDTVNGERESFGVETETLNLPIYMSRSEAQGVANTATWDKRVGTHTATIQVGARHGLKTQPGSVLTLVDHKGNSYRVLVRRCVLDRWVWTLDVRLDDPGVLVEAGVAVDEDLRVIDIAPPGDTEFLAIDGPLLRDADNAPHYLAITKTSDSSAARWFESADNVTFVAGPTSHNDAIFGRANSALADFAGGNVFDTVNSVTVDVGDGTLASSTRAAVLASKSVNAALIGAHGRWEAIQFVTATLVSAGVYTLSGLLRGRKGTEHAMDAHAVGDSFVLLGTAGTHVIGKEAGQLGVQIYVKAITAGRTLASNDSVAFTPTGVNMAPLSPVGLRIERDASNNATISWFRRTRLSYRITGPMDWSIPLGEASEAYKVRIYSDGTYTALLRTIDVTTTEASYTAAQQTADGLTPGNPIHCSVVQVSEAVGDGYALQDAA